MAPTAATTYLFELTHNNGEVFYKVGRTRREVDVRLAEVKSEMKAHFNRDISAKILRLIPTAVFSSSMYCIDTGYQRER